MRKNRMGNTKKSGEILSVKKYDTGISDLPDVSEVQKMITESIPEPARLYFSSPCLLAEIEDDEDILNR